MASEEVQDIEIVCRRSPPNDWSGISNTKERRKIQNKLAQRAYRKRKTQKNTLKIRFFHPSDDGCATVETQGKKRVFLKHPVVLETVPLEDKIPIDTPAEISLSPITSLPQEPIVEAPYSEVLTHDYRILADHQYINLIYYNIFRAFEVNTGSLGLTTSLLMLDILSPFNTDTHALTMILPPALQPTLIQITVPHHPSIDIFPSPRLRDNLILAGNALDQDEMCIDILGDCEVIGAGIAGLVVWGDPWDSAGWEMTEYFLKKWRWILEGADDIVASTNYWRALRGLGELDLGA